MGASHGVPCPMLPPPNLCNICALQADVPIKSAKLLGAHDSGTFSIDESSDLSPCCPPVTQKLRGIPGVGSIMKTIVCNWARTQAVDYANMLHLGVRYFDLRLWYSPKGEWVLVHGMVGETLAQAVADVSGFLADYPQEVVILYVKDIEPKLKDLSTEAASSLEQIFLRLPLVLRSAFTVNMPLGEIARIGNVLLAFEDDPSELLPKLGKLGLSFHGRELIDDPWGNCPTVESLSSFLLGQAKAAVEEVAAADGNGEIAEARHVESERRGRMLHVTQLVLSPSEEDITRGVKATLNIDKLVGADYPMTLHSICVRNRDRLLQLGQSLLLGQRDEQQEGSRPRVNILAVDFVEKFHVLLADLASPLPDVLLDGSVYEIRRPSTQRQGRSMGGEPIAAASPAKNTRLFATNAEKCSASMVRFRARWNSEDGSWTFLLVVAQGSVIDDGGQSRKPMHMWDLMPGNPNQRFLVRAAGNGTCTVHCCRDQHDAWDLSASGELSVMPFNNWPTQKFMFVSASSSR